MLPRFFPCQSVHNQIFEPMQGKVRKKGVSLEHQARMPLRLRAAGMTPSMA